VQTPAQPFCAFVQIVVERTTEHVAVTLPRVEHAVLDVQVEPWIVQLQSACHADALTTAPFSCGGEAVLQVLITQVLLPFTHVPLLLHVAFRRPTPPEHACAEQFAPWVVVRHAVCQSLPLTPTPVGRLGKREGGRCCAAGDCSVIVVQRIPQQQQQQQQQ
jgi:hypothetical protein